MMVLCAVHYNGLMLNEQSDTAVALFEGLECGGMKPDSVTWNSMIRGLFTVRKRI